MRIKLTENGQKIFEEIEAAMKLYFEKVFGAIPENKQEQVLKSMNLLVKAFLTNGSC